MLCPNCKSEIQPTDAFCGNCGQAIAQPAVAAAPQPVAAPAAPAPTPVPAVAPAPVTAPAPVAVPQPTVVAPAAPAAPAALPTQPTALNQQVPAVPIAGGAPAEKSSLPVRAIALGGAGIGCVVFMALLSVVFGTIAIVFAAKGMKYNKSQSIIGLVLGIISVIIGVVVWVLNIIRLSQNGDLSGAALPFLHVL